MIADGAVARVTGCNQGGRVSKRSILTRLAIVVPALVLIGALITTTMSCGGGIFPVATSSNTATPTATVSPGSGSFAYVTDFNTGKVVECKRNTSTGGLTVGTAVQAGATSGPVGAAVTQNNAFLFVANSADDNIYGYKIPASGVPSAVSTTAEGTNSAPQKIAISSDDSFLFVANGGKNAASGSVTSWNLDDSTGNLITPQTIPGPVSPFGIIVDNTDSFLFVADNGGGRVYSYSISSSGALNQLSNPLSLNGAAVGKPVDLFEDPHGTFLYVTDNNSSVVSAFSISSGVLTFSTFIPTTFSSATAPFGIAVGTVSGTNQILTANTGTGDIWSFLLTTPGVPNVPIAWPTSGSPVSGPKGLVIDPQGLNIYTADNGDGTVAQWSINPSVCGASTTVCFKGSARTEGSSTTSGPLDVELTH